MNRVSIAIIVVSFAAAGTLPRAGAPATDTQAREREIYVTVLDQQAKPVRDLTDPAAFVVREDGVSREVLRVTPATAPMQIALLVDNSQAATSSVTDLRLAMTAFVEALGGKNEIALITFGERPTISVESTTSVEAIKRGIGRFFAQPGSGAYLLDAIVEAARGLQKREAGRPVVVAVVIQAGPEFSSKHYNDVLEALGRAGAAFHTVVLAPAGDPVDLSVEAQYRAIVLDRGTKTTGGRRDDILASMNFTDSVKALAAELSSQYLVVYARPETLIPPERIEVSMARPGLSARGTPVGARPGGKS